MPSRRHRFLKNKKKVTKRKYSIGLAISLLAIGLIAVVWNINTNFWKNNSKISVLVHKSDDSVLVSVFDHKLGQIINILIPSNTQVEAAGGLGIWKLGSLWELGKKEKMGGQLLLGSVRRTFKFPISRWADYQALGYSDSNLKNLLLANFTSYSSDLTFSEKIALLIFSSGVKNPNRIEINLADTQLLKKGTLTDGEEGFLVSKVSSPKILSYFGDDYVANGSYKVAIFDLGAGTEISEGVGDIVQVMGAKVTSLSKSDISEKSCLIKGKDKRAVKNIANILSCKISEGVLSSGVDIEINLGTGFKEIY
ncbi:hypothetical protein A2955_04180 [Candidatus Woesebacteria bacterium RIFCSPLOWO2_01_FULL_37_19]|uniref:LytR/CpsA/Psr regulator C-terminal domain-containing protein n=2 Tax=Candidatus Woeseibacteriota TaxID=1752722 RepID=A0A1F8B274_9BACT|nr:MAG: hypothetical protein A2771_01205 [Candidatus Woesebacteria bacterium RIFCSPHIGHO2_01_FULL_38_26b]OGM57518.1 MAG: hypothetical protein A2955_04180 [Candidatus Woesebacteria bacterium RIFCSPLOWO2_01_FULL_37_19]